MRQSDCPYREGSKNITYEAFSGALDENSGSDLGSSKSKLQFSNCAQSNPLLLISACPLIKPSDVLQFKTSNRHTWKQEYHLAAKIRYIYLQGVYLVTFHILNNKRIVIFIFRSIKASPEEIQTQEALIVQNAYIESLLLFILWKVNKYPRCKCYQHFTSHHHLPPFKCIITVCRAEGGYLIRHWIQSSFHIKSRKYNSMLLSTHLATKKIITKVRILRKA